MRRKTHPALVVIAIALGLVGLVSSGQVGATVRSAATGHTSSNSYYVALGDSYSSGEGNPGPTGTRWVNYDGIPTGPPYKLLNNCDRSAIAYPMIVNSWLKSGSGLPAMDFRFCACGGATTGDLWVSGARRGAPAEPLQLSHASELLNARVITLSVGGNDLNFIDILTNCTPGVHTPHSCSSSSNDGWIADLHANILKLESTLVSTYKQILAAAPSATLYVVGYPDLLPPQPSTLQQNVTCPKVTTILPRGVGYLSYNEQALNNVVSAAVAQVPGVQYVDLNAGGKNSFVGHSVCARNSWFNGIRFVGKSRLLDPSYSFHPNATGQSHIAELVKAAIAASPPSARVAVGPKSSILIYGDNDDPSIDSTSDPSGMANLAATLDQSGFNVTTMPGVVSLPSDLSPYGQIWFYGIDPISPTDESTLETFVRLGGSVFLTGEWGDATHWNNQSIQDILTALLPTPVSVSGDDDSTGPLTVNTSVLDNVAFAPNTLTTWTPNRVGGLTGVAPSNDLIDNSSGNSSGAVWEVGQAGGRLAVLMDMNWAQSTYEDSTTMPEITQNIGYFLSQ
jgi:hypothetical protein